MKLTYSDFSAVMRYAKDLDVRKRLYVAYYVYEKRLSRNRYCQFQITVYVPLLFFSQDDLQHHSPTLARHSSLDKKED